MSTLGYLDQEGSINFRFVPWKILHNWLSELNGNVHIQGTLVDGVNRGQVIEELNARKKKKKSVVDSAIHRGYGEDWLQYENPQGYTHLEELLVYQPEDWRKQAREYLYSYKCNLERKSESKQLRTIQIPLTTTTSTTSRSSSVGRTRRATTNVSIFLNKPSLVVLLHPEIRIANRYQPLNFLLAYGAKNPIPSIPFENESLRTSLLHEISPCDYFFHFQKYVEGYDMNALRELGRQIKFKRLFLIKELDFSDIVGQRMAKQTIRVEVVNHLWNQWDNGQRQQRHSGRSSPLSMIFAGPSGNGKTEMAVWLSSLLNKPSDDAFIKVDCAQLQNAKEVFGMSGGYQGAMEGSALNNFVLRMSQEPESLGIVLLDEIEKATIDVIHGLYQVIDKGEWTNKKLVSRRSAQTSTIRCDNIILS